MLNFAAIQSKVSKTLHTISQSCSRSTEKKAKEKEKLSDEDFGEVLYSWWYSTTNTI
jgi:hypothetical protein